MTMSSDITMIISLLEDEKTLLKLNPRKTMGAKSKFGFAADFDFVSKDKSLDNVRLVKKSYKIPNNSILDLLASEEMSSDITVTILTLEDDKILLKINPQNTVKAIKEQIKSKLGYTHDIDLFSRNTYLDNARTAKYYKIQNGNVLNLVMNVEGGILEEMNCEGTVDICNQH